MFYNFFVALFIFELGILGNITQTSSGIMNYFRKEVLLCHQLPVNLIKNGDSDTLSLKNWKIQMEIVLTFCE